MTGACSKGDDARASRGIEWLDSRFGNPADHGRDWRGRSVSTCSPGLPRPCSFVCAVAPSRDSVHRSDADKEPE